MRPVPSPLVTLTTDYGAGSGYPAQLKGVLLSTVPDLRIVDVSHGVPAYDLLAGALLLEACVPAFPLDAIHLAVVDPGVGTGRRAICVVDPAGRRLVAPDNGLLTPFLGEGALVYHLADPTLVPLPRCATFHGRDLFAPVTAALALGLPPERLGPLTADPVRLDWPLADRSAGQIRGVTLSVDSFGNLITSIREADLSGVEVRVALCDGRPARWVRTFGDGLPGELLALMGSGGRVEIAVREGSAAAHLHRWRGVEVRLLLGGAATLGAAGSPC
jgi:S-adenosyl-L-methionine hydrolase (adenosine-forming)